MKSYLKVAAVMALLFMLGSIPARHARAEDESERPGAKEQAEVDKANTVLDGVYRELMSKGKPGEQASLREAERDWIKWRDAAYPSILIRRLAD